MENTAQYNRICRVGITAIALRHIKSLATVVLQWLQGFFFERAKRAFGPEEVERAVEDAKRREAQEREQKKAKRKFSRGAR